MRLPWSGRRPTLVVVVTRIAARKVRRKRSFQAELRARRRKENEDLSTLRADISRLMYLAFTGDVSNMEQKMAIDYFLDALDDPDFELKYERVSRNL